MKNINLALAFFALTLFIFTLGIHVERARRVRTEPLHNAQVLELWNLTHP